MTMIRRGAVAVAVLAATALVGCTDGSDDGDGSGSTEQTTVTVTSTASSPEQPESTTGEDAPPVPDLPEPVQSPGEIVGSSDISTGSTTGGPALGDACIGANIGMRATAADGTAIICDNYSWQVDVGQEASHPWVDGQIEWGNCIAEKTVEECRAELNG